MIKTTIGVDGMACGMCESHINDVIRKNFKVKSVKSSAKKACTIVIAEEALDEVAVHEAIDPTGYTVTSVSSEEYIKKGLFGR